MVLGGVVTERISHLVTQHHTMGMVSWAELCQTRPVCIDLF